MPVPCLCTVVTCNVDVSEHYELGIPLPMFYYGRPAQQMLCYIFALLFLLCIFFSSPNLSRCRLDVYHTSTDGVASNVLHTAR